MIRLILLLFLLMLPVTAQEMEQLIPIQRGDIKKNIFFCIDKSGSMNASDLGRAIDLMIMIASQSVDEVNIASSAFGEGSDRWEGVENNKTPPQWAEMPDQDAIDKLKEWFTKSSVGQKETIPSPSIADGLDEPVRDLSIIIISDGQFNGPDGQSDALIGKIRGWQASRTKQKLPQAKIGILAITPTRSVRNKLKYLCESVNAWLVEIK